MNALHALHEDGFVLLPGLLDAAQVAEVRGLIDDLRPIHWDYEGLVDHYKCVFNRSPRWLPYLDPPGLIEVAEAALGEDCHVIGQTAWRCHPGFIGGDMHQDYLPLRLPEALLLGGFELPMFICTAQVYLDDIDRELCPTWVIPGSHRAGRAPHPDERSWRGRAAEPVLCRAGDCLLFRSDLWHSGSRNLSQRAQRRSRLGDGELRRLGHDDDFGHLRTGGIILIRRQRNGGQDGDDRDDDHQFDEREALLDVLHDGSSVV